jgi:RHS repeat-associated protein
VDLQVQRHCRFGVDQRTYCRPFGWEGASQRPTDRTPNLTSLIQMGARPYAPQIGRFLAVDPVEGGATTNPYGYVNDPVNTEDLNGKCVFGSRKTGGCKGGIRAVANTFNAGKRGVFTAGRGAQRGVSAAAGWVGRNFSVHGLSNIIGSVLGGLSWVQRHLVVGVSICLFFCLGISTQNGKLSFSTGSGAAVSAGVSIGVSSRESHERECEYSQISGKWGPIGLYGQVGTKDGRSTGDVEGGWSGGLGGGVATWRSHGGGC